MTDTPVDLLVVYPLAGGGRYRRWAERSADGVWGGVRGPLTMEVAYCRQPYSSLKYSQLPAQADRARWVLMLDADTEVTGDVGGLLSGMEGKVFAARRDVVPERKGWDQAAYDGHFLRRRMTPMPLPHSAVFLVRGDLARPLFSAAMRWNVAVRKMEPWWGTPRKKFHQPALAFALSELAVCESEVRWWGPEWVSWEGHETEKGLIHHYSGSRLKALEAKEGKG